MDSDALLWGILVVQNSGALKKKKILLVEQMEVAALDESRLLLAEGFDVVIAYSEEEAVSAAAGTYDFPDLILMSLDLGQGIDGAEAARRILEIRDIPLLFLLRNTESAVVSKAGEICSYGYLVQPVAPSVLFASIRMAFRVHDDRNNGLNKTTVNGKEGVGVRLPEDGSQLCPQDFEDSEQRFRLLVENSRDAIFIQMNGLFEYCNSSALKLFGAESAEQILGSDVVERFHPDYRDKVRLRIRNLNTRKEPAPRVDENIIRMNGEVVEVEVYAVPFSLNGQNGALVYMHDLTSQRESERKIREGDTLLSMMSAMAHIGGWEFDQESGEGSWTKEVARIHDLDPDGPTNVSMGLSFFTPESRPKIEAAIQETMESGTSYDLELELVSAAGVRKWIRTMGRQVVESGSRKIAGTFQDITAIKKTEDALRERNERFAVIVENTQDWIVCFGRRAEILYANPAVTRYLGISGTAYAGKTLREVGVPDLLSSLLETNTSAVFETKEIVSVQFEAALEGVLHVFELKLCPERDQSGGVASVVGIARDMTERVTMENATRRLSQQFQAMFMDHKAVMLLISPANGEILAGNGAASAYYGYPLEILCSMHIHDINRLPKEEVDMEMRAAKDEDRNYFVFPHHLASGDVRTVEVYSSPIEIGTQKLLFSVIHDITDRCRAESALAQSLREKEVLFKELQHRVKNNLSVVSGLLTLELDTLSDEKAKDVLLSARARIMSIARIYDNLCRSFEVEEVELGKYMHDFIDDLYSTYVFDQERIKFSSKIESLTMDLKRAVPLCLIINELVINALKYAYPAPAHGEIRIEIRRENGAAVISVADDGVGMRHSHEESVSMGSYLVKMLTSQIGGTVVASGGETGGAVVELRMPL
jgi:PAS domain S-box-containing protein